MVSHGQVVGGTPFVDILMPAGPPWTETRWTISADCAQLCVGARASCDASHSNWCRFPNCGFPAPASWPPWIAPSTPAPPSPPFIPPPAPPTLARATCGSSYGWNGVGKPCPDPRWEPRWALNLSTATSNIVGTPEEGSAWGLVTYPWNLNNSEWQNVHPHRGEQVMARQCALVKAHGTGTRCMVYRQNELSLQWQETSRAAQTAANSQMFLQFKSKALCDAAAPCNIAAFHQMSQAGKPLVACNKSAPVSAPNCAYCCNFTEGPGTGVCA